VTNQVTAFAVFTVESGTSGAGRLVTLIYPDYNNPFSANLIAYDTGSNTLRHERNGVGYNATSNALTFGVPSLASTTINGAATTMHLNGTQVLSITTVGSNLGYAYYTIGCFGQAIAGNAYTWRGYVGEVILYGNALSTAQRQAVEGYLSWKWGTEIIPQVPSVPGVAPLSVLAGGPTDVPGLALWLDAADRQTLTFASGSSSNVTVWADKSGSGNNFTLTSGTCSAITDGEKRVISFPSGAIMTSSSSITFTTSSAFYIVFRLISNAGISMVLGFSSISSSDYSIRLSASGLVGTPGTFGGANDLGNGTYFVNGSSNPTLPLTTYSNSYAVVGTVQPSTGGTSVLTLSSSFTSRFFVGNIAEVLYYPSGLNTTQRQQVEGYLGTKWGITVATPSSIKGLALWLDASDAATFTYSSGSNVSQWSDKSGTANHAVRGIWGTFPTRTSSNTVLFSNSASSTQYLNTQVGRQTTRDVTFIMAVKVLSSTGTTNGGNFLDQRKEATGWALNAISSVTFLSGDVSPNSTVNISNTFPLNTTMVVTYQTKLNTTAAYVNSVLIGSMSSTLNIPSADTKYITIGALTDVIGSSANQITYSAACEFSELMMFNYYLSSTQRQQVESYLSTKWGVQVSPYTPLLSRPANVPGCVVWLDASDSSTLTLSSGNMTQWTDKSGVGNSMTPYSTYSNATVSTAFQGGLNVLNFSGTAVYKAPASSAVYPLDVYIVLALKDTTSILSPFAINTNSGTDNFNGLDFSEYTTSRWHNGSSFYNRTPNTVSPSNETSTSFLLINWSIADGNYVIRRNGVQLSQTASYTWTMTAGSIFQVGYIQSTVLAPSPSAQWFKGYIGEIVAFNYQLGTTQRQAVERYLTSKWGLTTLYASVPGSVPGVTLWLDASDPSTFSFSSGSNVSIWRDKSGNGYDGTTTNASVGSPVAPTYVTNSINGLSAVTMSGTSYFTGSTNVNSTTLTAFFVGNCVFGTGGSTQQRILGLGVTGLDDYSSTLRPIPLSVINSGTTLLAYRNANMATATVVSGTNFVGCCVFDGTSNYMYVNGKLGTQVASSGTFTTSIYGVGSDAGTQNSGGAAAFGTNCLVGKIGEMIVFNTALNTTQRQAVESYLSRKWGISVPTESLPVAHPFYSIKPFSRTFQPVDIDGCALWLDGADQNAMTLSGSNVTQWIDKSPLATPFTLSNGSGGSTIWTTYTGLPVVQVSNSCFFNASYSYPLATRSIFFVMAEIVHSDWRGLLCFANTAGQSDYNTQNGYVITSTNTVGSNVQFSQNQGNGGFVFNYNASNGIKDVPFQLYEDVTSNTAVTLFITGSSVYSSNTSVTPLASTGITVGGRGGIPSSGALVIAEVLVYSNVLTASQRQQVETYLIRKWKILLPSPGTLFSTTAQSSPSFVPTSISGCSLWLDGADSNSTSNITTGIWYDKSGLGRTATSNSGASAFSMGTINSIPAVTFPSASASALIAQAPITLSSTVGFSIFFVAKWTAGSSDNVRFFCTQFNAGGTLDIELLGSNAAFPTTADLYGGTTSGAADLYGFTIPANTPFVYSTVFTSTAANGYSHWLNGVSGGSQTPAGAGTVNGMVIGNYTAPGAAYAFIGQMGEFIMFSNALNTAQRQQVEYYLSKKWNIASATNPFLTNCKLWLDGADVLGNGSATPTTITTWADKSGTGNTVTALGQAIIGTQMGPFLPGASHFSITGGFVNSISNTPFVIFCVETPSAWLGDYCVLIANDNTNAPPTGNCLHITYRNSNDLAFAFYASDLEVTASPPTPFRNGVTRVWTFYLPAAANRNVRLNGSVVATHTNYSYLGRLDAPVIGRDFGSYGGAYVGTMSEIIVYNADIGLPTIQSIESYLMAKWQPGTLIPKYTIPPDVALPFLPTNISDCSLWLDAGDPTTITGSSPVTAWKDKSSNTYLFTGTGAVISNSGLYFNGSSYLTNGAITAIAAPYTIFAVGSSTSQPNTFQRMISGGVKSGDPYDAILAVGTSNTTPFVWFGYTGNWLATPYLTGSAYSGSSLFITGGTVTSGTSPTLFGYGNGTQLSSNVGSANTATSLTGLNIGGGYSSAVAGSQPWYGNINEIIIYNTVLTTARRRLVEGYLASKWGLQQSLPTIVKTPLSISGCAVWLDGADASTVSFSSGSNVSQWSDKSGSGNNATQSTSANQPTYSSNGMVFAGSNWFQTPITSFPTAESLFIVFKSSTAVADIFAGTTSTSREVLLYTGTKVFLGRFGSDPAAITPNAGVIPLNTPLLYSHQFTTTAVTFTVNGTVTGSGTPPYTYSGTGTSWIGSSGYAANNMNGTIYEIIYYNTSLTASERRSVETYLTNKWGISNTDPVIPNPYSSFPPSQTYYPSTAAVAFSPTSISGIQLWMDAADSSAASMTLSGSTVTVWKDKSGNNNHTTARSGSPALTSAAINGKSAISMAGGYYTGPFATANTGNQAHAFAVITIDSSTGQWPRPLSLGRPGANDYPDSTTTFMIIRYNGTQAVGIGRNGQYLSVGFPAYSSPFLVQSSHNGSMEYMSVNGTLTPSSYNDGQSGNFNITSYGLGVNTNTGDYFVWNGYYAEVIYYNAQLSDANRQKVEGYLAWKWGLQASLPSGHPYAGAAP